mmetsp:Transcript_37894/g.100848  ORF Transcript_37894/g.100848 Transcript_37894/m.100848 type:complete len:93 (-) Transcript_37894:21-299(-)
MYSGIRANSLWRERGGGRAEGGGSLRRAASAKILSTLTLPPPPPTFSTVLPMGGSRASKTKIHQIKFLVKVTELHHMGEYAKQVIGHARVIV